MSLVSFSWDGNRLSFEYMDSTVNTPDQVWRAVPLATFGVVPDLNLLNRRQYSLNQLVMPLLKRVNSNSAEFSGKYCERADPFAQSSFHYCGVLSDDSYGISFFASRKASASDPSDQSFTWGRQNGYHIEPRYCTG